jgi:hypothetical protein
MLGDAVCRCSAMMQVWYGAYTYSLISSIAVDNQHAEYHVQVRSLISDAPDLRTCDHVCTASKTANGKSHAVGERQTC